MTRFSERLKAHINICKANLKNPKIKRCAKCPFEEIICFHYPETKELFEVKRKLVGVEEEEINCLGG